jgi:lincosamide nucleotidyltransferase A/C/D/E
MKFEDVIELYKALESLGITIWLDGGWAVDALLGEQTRPHEDVDIVIQEKDVSVLRKYLESQNYHDIIRDDTSSWNFVLGDKEGHLIDIHVIRFEKEGNGLYGPKGEMYPAGSLVGVGKIGDLPVKCISADHLVKFHTGYKVDEKDYKDVVALCERFNLELPREYIGFDKKMKIMVFTEGTLLMHPSGKGVSREERVKQTKTKLLEMRRFKNYIPVDNAVKKLKIWVRQGAEICYLTSRRSKKEVSFIQQILDKYNFPKGELYFRNKDEEYKDVAERVMPDILIEDDCESIGGEVEMTYPHIKLDLKQKIKSIVVKEFGGIDNLPDNLN